MRNSSKTEWVVIACVAVVVIFLAHTAGYQKGLSSDVSKANLSQAAQQDFIVYSVVSNYGGDISKQRWDTMDANIKMLVLKSTLDNIQEEIDQRNNNAETGH